MEQRRLHRFVVSISTILGKSPESLRRLASCSSVRIFSNLKKDLLLHVTVKYIPLSLTLLAYNLIDFVKSSNRFVCPRSTAALAQDCGNGTAARTDPGVCFTDRPMPFLS